MSLAVLLLLFSHFGYVFFSGIRTVSYHYVRAHRQHIALRDTIRGVSVETYAGNSRDMIWMKKDEVRYKDKMFDVKQVLRCGKEVLLIGHYDGFESKLFKLLFRYLGDDNDDAQGSHSPLTWLVEAVLTYIEKLTFLPPPAVVRFYGCLREAAPTRTLAPPYLPPDVLLLVI